MIVKYLMNVYESYIKSLDVTPKEFPAKKKKLAEWEVGKFPGSFLFPYYIRSPGEFTLKKGMQIN